MNGTVLPSKSTFHIIHQFILQTAGPDEYYEMHVSNCNKSLNSFVSVYYYFWFQKQWKRFQRVYG